jgi:hypothetical protein
MRLRKSYKQTKQISKNKKILFSHLSDINEYYINVARACLSIYV